MPDITDINGVAVASLGDFNGVAKASITDINGVTLVSAVNLLLDTYTGAAAAYSVRKLDKDYTGYCMRIVVDSAATVGTLDSSDPEYDIGFDSNGDLDTAEIVTRCNNPSGTNYNAYVTKWYDQSGNGNDVAQSSYTAMPQIATAGAVITENGKPMLKSAAGVFMTASGLEFVNSKVFSVASLHRTGVWLQRRTETGVVSGGWLLAAEPSSTSTALYHTATFSSLSLAKNGASYTLSGNRDNLYNDFEDQHLLYAATSGTAISSSMELGYKTTPDPYSMWNQQELIIYPSTSSHSQSAIETNINLHFQIGNFSNPTSGLLSTYTGAAAAYSVRQLANTASKCMRIVVDSAATVGTLDSSDPEYDIGFDSNGDLDTAAIVSYCNNPSGTNYNAYVTKWYDQSGNGNDAAQTTHANMPQIASTGAVITDNGKPALLGGYFENISGISKSSNWSSFEVYNSNGDTNFVTYAGDSAPNSHSILAYSGLASSSYIRNFGSPDFYVDGSSVTITTMANAYTTVGTSTQLLLSIIDADNATWDAFYLRAWNVNQFTFAGYMQEQIFFGEDKTSERSAIETNINNYYSIY